MVGIVIFLIILACLAIALFCCAGSAWSKKESSVGSACFLIGLLLMFGLVYFETKLTLGFPKTEIDPGIYKVGFVSQAGDNVSVGIEEEGVGMNKTEHLFFYQLPLADFDRPIGSLFSFSPNTKKLVAYKLTTSEGTFNKYKLE